jgi:hypothetical protein
LELFANNMKGFKGNRKTKGVNEIKMNLDPGETIRPSLRSQPAAHLLFFLNRYLSPLSPR